ncbi:MAG TPA: hypothetical protein VND99_02150 [Candidatus Acidoferrales bacterium]|nr:hypothetical protein [Candidatus Acidoferrales bacterium]
MKYWIFVLLFVFTLLAPFPVFAQVSVPSVFYCVGNNLQPPCVTLSPSQTTQLSSAPSQSVSPAVSSNPQPSETNNPSGSPVPSANPCTTTQSSVSIQSASSLRQTKKKKKKKSNKDKDHDTDKKHIAGKKGALQKFIQLLLQLIEQLLQQLKLVSPISNPCPQPSTSPAPSSGVSLSPSSSPSISVGPTNCTPSAILVNPCRPWFGAAAKGNPGAAADRISQFDYLEKITGRTLDIYHDYDSATRNANPLNSDEIHFAQRPNTYIYVNWEPAATWAEAGGGNAATNAVIDKAAVSVKSIAPHKIFMTIWHEPENDVSPGTSNCPGLKGTAGSPAQYRAMWQNVESRFKADGVTNVVWVMNYMGYYVYDCLIPQMWPGNNLVDWVAYDVYGTNNNILWADSVGRMYTVLKNDQSSTTDFASKPWALAEFGTCKMTNEQSVYQYFQSAKAAIEANTYPKLKMYMIYADTGNNAGPGCLTNTTITGASDPTRQTYFNQFANDPIFLKK